MYNHGEVLNFIKYIFLKKRGLTWYKMLNGNGRKRGISTTLPAIETLQRNVRKTPTFYLRYAIYFGMIQPQFSTFWYSYNHSVDITLFRYILLLFSISRKSRDIPFHLPHKKLLEKIEYVKAEPEPLVSS